MIPCQPVNDAALTASHIELEFGYIRVMLVLFVNCIKIIACAFIIVSN